MIMIMKTKGGGGKDGGSDAVQIMAFSVKEKYLRPYSIKASTSITFATDAAG